MTSIDLCELAELSDDARQAAQSGLPVRTFIEQLARGGQVRAAINALALFVPKVEAIAWGLASVRSVNAAMAKPGAEGAVESIEQWLAAPNDERRRAARIAAEKGGIAT